MRYTLEELMKELRKYPPDALVSVADDTDFPRIDYVRESNVLYIDPDSPTKTYISEDYDVD